MWCFKCFKAPFTLVEKCAGLSVVAAATLQLKLPGNVTTYVVFAGRLTVAYAIDKRLNFTSATIDLVELFPANDSVLSVVTSFNLPTTGLLSGEFSLSCGTIDHAGRYRLQLDFDADVGMGSTRTGPMEAVWPPVVVSLPPTHVVLDSRVRVAVTMPRDESTTPRCSSLHSNPGRFSLELVYSGRVETQNGHRVVEPRKVKNIFALLFLRFSSIDRNAWSPSLRWGFNNAMQRTA